MIPLSSICAMNRSGDESGWIVAANANQKIKGDYS